MSEKFVKPKVDLIGKTVIDEEGLKNYLKRSNNEDFIKSWDKAKDQGLSDSEILCSFYAKLCYKALSLGKNTNITRTRDIWDNLLACFDHGHGSVFEHCNLNFIISDCSRVFTHELVRHRIGTAFSQTSGRYCRLDNIPIVWDPILDPVKDLFEECLQGIEDTIYLAECRLGLRRPPVETLDVKLNPKETLELRNQGNLFDYENHKWVPDSSFDFTTRKKITSAIRRIAPNGQSNEIGFSVNLRSLRHTVLMRTSRSAEWEIREVFAQIYNIVKQQYPLIFFGAKEELHEGIVEVSGLRTQPYEKSAQMLLDEMTDAQIELYMKTRPKSLSA